jgi:hypothetical protein
MSVVPFAGRGWLRRGTTAAAWTPEEARELRHLYESLCTHGLAVDWERGETECGDPQLYLLGSDPDASCVVSVSRLLRDGRDFYVIENGGGAVIAEGPCLKLAVELAARRGRNAKSGRSFMSALLGGALAYGSVAADMVTDVGASLALDEETAGQVLLAASQWLMVA